LESNMNEHSRFEQIICFLKMSADLSWSQSPSENVMIWFEKMVEITLYQQQIDDVK